VHQGDEASASARSSASMDPSRSSESRSMSGTGWVSPGGRCSARVARAALERAVGGGDRVVQRGGRQPEHVAQQEDDPLPWRATATASGLPGPGWVRPRRAAGPGRAAVVGRAERPPRSRWPEPHGTLRGLQRSLATTSATAAWSGDPPTSCVGAPTRRRVVPLGHALLADHRRSRRRDAGQRMAAWVTVSR
jgi:hypothetical protein